MGGWVGAKWAPKVRVCVRVSTLPVANGFLYGTRCKEPMSFEPGLASAGREGGRKGPHAHALEGA